MATTKKQPAKRPAKKPAVPTPVKVVEQPRELTTAEQVHAKFDQMLVLYVGGYSLAAAMAELLPEVSSFAARAAIMADEHMKARWLAVKEYRSHYFFEAAGDAAASLVRSDPKAAGDLYLKLAAKTNPAEYGDKSTVALTGADGGPVQSVVEMTPSEAYQRMLRGNN